MLDFSAISMQAKKKKTSSSKDSSIKLVGTCVSGQLTSTIISCNRNRCHKNESLSGTSNSDYILRSCVFNRFGLPSIAMFKCTCHTDSCLLSVYIIMKRDVSKCKCSDPTCNSIAVWGGRLYV